MQQRCFWMRRCWMPGNCIGHQSLDTGDLCSITVNTMHTGKLYTMNYEMGEKNVYTVFQKKESYQTLAITLSNFYRFRKFFHCQTQWEICSKCYVDIPPHLTYVATLPCKTRMTEKPTKFTTKQIHFCHNMAKCRLISIKMCTLVGK